MIESVADLHGRQPTPRGGASRIVDARIGSVDTGVGR
jgi:hypothetical protein